MTSTTFLNDGFQWTASPGGAPAASKSAIHKMALALVAITIGSGAVVFSEPAPVDALTILLIVLLPVIGLVRIRPSLIVILSGLLILAGCAMLASIFASDVARAVTHTAISLYLYAAAITFAAFVARNPVAHTRLILESYRVAAVIAAVAGIVGYFDLVPGAADWFTKFDRASGPFKDPNVFGAFLVLAAVYELHLAVTRRGAATLLNFAGLALIMLAILLSISRGAWAATGFAVLCYGYLSFVTAKRNLDRVKLICLALAGIASTCLIVFSAMQSDAVANLLEQRAALTQSYDEGPDGRFGGHQKARGLILENPLGIGAREFVERYHTEDVHNVYLSMFLNAGWLGGLLYVMIIALTLVFGLRHAFKHTSTQQLYIVAFSALVATLLLGMLIDSDHWRHLYLLLGLVWGLMAGDRKIVRSPRIIANRRPLLLHQRIELPPSRRGARILARTTSRPRLPMMPAKPRRPRRPARILAKNRPILL